jgi:transposase
MKGTRKRHSAAFRARVALEAAKQTRTLAELATTFQVHSVQISQWKKQLLDGIESLFQDGRRRDHDRIDLVWLRPNRGLARRLLKEPGWNVLHRDEVSILFQRTEAGGPSANEGKMAHR